MLNLIQEAGVLPEGGVAGFFTHYQMPLATLLNVGVNFALASLPTKWATLSNKLKVVSSFVSAFVIYQLLGVLGGKPSAELTGSAAQLVDALFVLVTGSAAYWAGRNQPGNVPGEREG
jgi:hypothetical protein